MKCIICDNESAFFFKKKFEGIFKTLISSSEYFKCKNCGFTFSPTIFELTEDDFSKLNIAFHLLAEDPLIEINVNQPPYIEQATMLNILEKNKLIDMKSALDFGGGYGTLNKIIKKYFNGFSFLIFDPYMQDISDESNIYVEKHDLGQYKTVFNSAFFEHITNRITLEQINSCVSEEGVLIIHTVVCENIPNDPNWFYINPVHCAIHTNKSMEFLMKQWNYKWSLYCPGAKCWILFKSKCKNERKIIDKINREFQIKYFYYKINGFVDYWKGY